MIATDSFEQVEIRNPQALWTWLDEHHAEDRSVWLVTWKAARRDRYVSRDQVLDALVAYGWIDGVRRTLDEARSMQLVSPCKQQIWAETYKTRAARLRADGRVHQAGEAGIAAAKSAGLWSAMDHLDALVVPEDLARALGRGRDWGEAAAPS